MLHHFSQRAELVRAAVEHLHEKRLQEYERDLRALNEDAKHTLVAEGIEVFGGSSNHHCSRSIVNCWLQQGPTMS